MSVYKTLISCVKRVPQTGPSGYTYIEEQSAYSEYQYFSTLEKAKRHCQQYVTSAITWESIGDDCWSGAFENGHFNIYLEQGAEFDTLGKPPLPTKFAARQHYGD